MNNNEYQAILARDMINMIREFADEADALEYLESFAFSLARMLGNEVVDWDTIANVCDQRYWSLGGGSPAPLDGRALDHCNQMVQRYLPPETKEDTTG